MTAKMVSEKFSPEQADLAVAELRYQTAYYLEAVQAMMDGVTLGAENVQDKRIELLEVGPTTDPHASILTVVLTLVLEGTVGSAIAALAVRTVLIPMMRGTATAILKMEKRSAFEKLRLFRETAASKSQAALLGKGLSSPQRVDLILEARKLNTAADLLKRDMRGRVGSAKQVRESINRIANFTENNLVAVAKAALAVKGLPGSSAPLPADRSPGVSVLAAAMASAARLRLNTIATHEALEAEIKNPAVTLDEVSKLLDEYRVDDRLELAEIRDGCALTTEVMIWADLFVTATLKTDVDWLDSPAKIVNPGPSQRATRLSTFSGEGIPYGGLRPTSIQADKKLIEYLIVRFGKEVERWALENNALLVDELRKPAIRLAVPPRPTGWWEGMNYENRSDLLARYLTFVSDRTPSQELNLG